MVVDFINNAQIKVDIFYTLIFYKHMANKHIKVLLFKNKHIKPLEKKNKHIKSFEGQIWQLKYRNNYRFWAHEAFSGFS